ncbi:hypothetical protein QA640_47525 (plasmid) [Bradyrhizobium sp. CB82]|uniref:hypothetical protein n=1 Tax=Bradyrhizobium sp. CB82 TaxID=3039159 RepID=UPI0024B25832|nr:hypothetical protein [Bradyrhizobium sp. CB82]WFU45637.1 hypothetical protein QA640_47525 [Bradyrhizobium sp. CB82]
MKIAVANEVDPSEPRAATSPDTTKVKALGAEIGVERGRRRHGLTGKLHDFS